VNSIYLEQLKTAGTEMKTGLQNSKQSKQFDYKFKDQTYFLSFPDEKKEIIQLIAGHTCSSHRFPLHLTYISTHLQVLIKGKGVFINHGLNGS
jgi:hypothetical protein